MQFRPVKLSKMKALALIVFLVTGPQLGSFHQFHLMPYPIFKERADDTWELNDFVVNNGQFRRQARDFPETPVITSYNQHQFNPDSLDTQTFVVGAKYNIGSVQDVPYVRQPRQLATPENYETKKVFLNGRFSRGIKDFKPSPKVNGEVEHLLGDWYPGTIPGEYNWRGLDSNPMDKYRSHIGEFVYY